MSLIHVPLFDFAVSANGPVRLGTKPESAVDIVRFGQAPPERQTVLVDLGQLGLWPRRKPPEWVACVQARVDEAPRRTMDRLLVALKLLQGDYVNAYYLACDPAIGVLGRDFLPHYMPMGLPGRGAYKLTEEAVSRARIEWDTFFEIPHNFGVVRFNIAEHRPYAWDVFADLAFALEYLIAPAENGLAYQCRLGAALLHPASKDRARLVDRMDAIYDLRSCIVHGDEYLWRAPGRKAVALQSDDWSEPTLLVRGIVREFLRLFALSGKLRDAGERRQFILSTLLERELPSA
jgi:hypothetical protein